MTFSASLYFHDILSLERTKELLTEDNSYLVRRSPLNPDKFILSYLVKNHVKHEIVESSKSSRKNIIFEDVACVIQDMVSSNQNCLHAVFPPAGQIEGGSLRHPGESLQVYPRHCRDRDEDLSRKMKLPFRVVDIINSPLDSFNELLTRPGLTAEQIKLCHDIRRRGMNKDEDCEELGGDDEQSQEHSEDVPSSSSKSRRKKKKSAGQGNSCPADKEAKD